MEQQINLQTLSAEQRKEQFETYASKGHNGKKGLKLVSLKKYVSGLVSKEMEEKVKKYTGQNTIFDLLDIDDVKQIRDEFSKKKDVAKEKTLKDRYRDYASYVLKYMEFLAYCQGVDAPKDTEEEFADGFSIAAVIKQIAATGLIYEDSLVKRFAFSLLAKPFVILSGLAGSGKTQLALAFAHSLCANPSEQVLLVPVGADWTNREPLLGFANTLTDNEYVFPESGVLQFLLKAIKDKSNPYFLILDEMNMSYVERYFADFLSAMESGKSINLWSGKNENVPQSITLPPNLFVVGTINVDETTYMFSPKVLDRASVIEFRIDHAAMQRFLSNASATDIHGMKADKAMVGEHFVAIADDNEMEALETIANTLLSCFDELKKANAEFGFRSAKEIYRFAYVANENDDTDEPMTTDEIVDAAIIQKLLPKLHGSFKAIRGVLSSLWGLCFVDEVPDIVTTNLDATESDDAYNIRYAKAAEKIQRMYLSAQANGFTSFAEA